MTADDHNRTIVMWTIIRKIPNLVAMLALLLAPVMAVPQELMQDEVLQREWIEIQEYADRETRKSWWQDLGVEQLSAYVEAGADISATDRRGWTVLHSAARYSADPEVLSALLQAGVVIDARDSSGDTALHWASAENTNVEVIKRLLDAGADVNARDRFGWLPIHTAAEASSNPDVIEALLTAGAERNKRAYFVFFRPEFLLKHNSNMSEKDKKIALELFD
jgi:hypothetical protein